MQCEQDHQYLTDLHPDAHAHTDDHAYPNEDAHTHAHLNPFTDTNTWTDLYHRSNHTDIHTHTV